MPDPALVDEAARAAALDRYAVLDTDPEAPFDKITALVRAVLGVPIAAVSLIDADRQWFKSRQGLTARETARNISFCTHTIRQRVPMIVPDVRTDRRFANNPLVTGAPHIRSYAGVPLKTHDGYNVGALCAIDSEPRSFTAAQIAILTNFAGLVIDELELRQIAGRDHLTGALTRRGLLAEAEKEIARWDRHGRPATLVMIDIDHFKTINDRYGHAAGDRVLKAVADACRLAMRSDDVFGRIGGEEFALLLPKTEVTAALAAAEQLRDRIAGLSIDIGTDAPVGVTASFGAAPLSADVQTAERWLAKADVPLYAAKHGGRNRCCIAAH